MKVGDIIRNKASGKTYVVTQELYDGTHIAVESLHICNPPEWEVLADQAQDQLLSDPAVMAELNRAHFGRKFCCIRHSEDSHLLELIFLDGTVIRIRHNNCEWVR